MTLVKNQAGLFIVFFLFSCSTSTKIENQSAGSELASTKIPAGEFDIKKLLTKFKETPADTLKVISSLDFDATHYPFKGVLLDSIDVTLLPVELAKTYDGDKNFYACFKFPLDNNHTGLIIRTPSMYTPSSIKLFVLNTSTHKILNTYIELAETVIQMVEYWDKKTFIVRDKKSTTTLLMWEHQNEDTTEIFYTIRFIDEQFDTLSVVTK